MKLKDIYTISEFNNIKKFLPDWEYENDYSEDKIDIFDEEIENVEIKLVLTNNSQATFIADMVDKLREHPLYNT